MFAPRPRVCCLAFSAEPGGPRPSGRPREPRGERLCQLSPTSPTRDKSSPSRTVSAPSLISRALVLGHLRPCRLWRDCPPAPGSLVPRDSGQPATQSSRRTHPLCGCPCPGHQRPRLGTSDSRFSRSGPEPKCFGAARPVYPASQVPSTETPVSLWPTPPPLANPGAPPCGPHGGHVPLLGPLHN